MTDLFYPYPRKEDLKRLAEWLKSESADSNHSQDDSSSKPKLVVTDGIHHLEGIDYTLCINPLSLNDRELLSTIVNKVIENNPNRKLAKLTFMEEKEDGAYSDCLLQAEVKTVDNQNTLQTIRDNSSNLPINVEISVDAIIEDDRTVIQNYIKYDETFQKFKDDYNSGISDANELKHFQDYFIDDLLSIYSKCLTLTFTCTSLKENSPKEVTFDLFSLLSKSGYLGEVLKSYKSGPFDMRKFLLDKCKTIKDCETVARKIQEYMELDKERLTRFFKSAFERPAVIVKNGLLYYDNLYEAIISLVVKDERLKAFFPETMVVNDTYSLVLNPFFSKFKMTEKEGFERLFSLSGKSEFEEKTQTENFKQKRTAYHTHILASAFTTRIMEILKCPEKDMENLYQELLSIVRQDYTPKRTILTDEKIKKINEILAATLKSAPSQPKKQSKQSDFDNEYIKKDHDYRVHMSLDKFLKRLQDSRKHISNSDEANSNDRISISDEAEEVKKMMLHTNLKKGENLNWHTVNMDYLILHYSLRSTFPTSESISINDAGEIYNECISKKILIPEFSVGKTKSNIRSKHISLLKDFYDSVIKGMENEQWAEAWATIVLYDCIKKVDKLLTNAKGTAQKYLLYDAYLQRERTKQFESQRRLWESSSWLQKFAAKPSENYVVNEKPDLVTKADVEKEVMAGKFANTGASVLTDAIKALAPQ